MNLSTTGPEESYGYLFQLIGRFYTILRHSSTGFRQSGKHSVKAEKWSTMPSPGLRSPRSSKGKESLSIPGIT